MIFNNLDYLDADMKSKRICLVFKNVCYKLIRLMLFSILCLRRFYSNRVKLNNLTLTTDVTVTYHVV